MVLPAVGERRRERQLNASACVLPAQQYRRAEGPRAQQDAHTCWKPENKRTYTEKRGWEMRRQDRDEQFGMISL